MKKIIYSLLFVITAVCAACDEELPKASFDLYELKTLTATAGDMNVALSWEAYPDARPDEYLISGTYGNLIIRKPFAGRLRPSQPDFLVSR